MSTGSPACKGYAAKSGRDSVDERKAWKVRPMRESDIAKSLDIWLQVELTEAHQTVASTLATDPDGFYVAEIDGQVIGMCAGPMTREDTAFMGLYAIQPKYQGIGVGRELWSRTVERLGADTNIGLCGVPAMSEKYKRSGFKIEDSIRMLIFESVYSNNSPGGDTSHEVYLDCLKPTLWDSLKATLIFNDRWLILSEEPRSDLTSEREIFEKLVDYDKEVNQFSRRKLLSNYLMNQDAPLTVIMVASSARESRRRSADCVGRCHSGAHTTHGQDYSDTSSEEQETGEAAQDLSKGNDHVLSSRAKCCLSISKQHEECSDYNFSVVGYGCIRHDNTGGGMIGPLYADTAEICECILKQLLLRFPLSLGAKYSVMSLTSNGKAAEILRRIGLKEIDQCSRMFTKFIPLASYDKVYYVHSPNFTLF